MTLALSRALLCVNCEALGESLTACELCGSTALLPLRQMVPSIVGPDGTSCRVLSFYEFMMQNLEGERNLPWLRP